MQRKTLTFAFMDPPPKSAPAMITMRLIEIAVRRGHDVNVFAYEGDAPPEAQTNDDRRGAPPGDWIAGLMHEATAKGVKVDWVRCTHETEGGEPIVGVRRGSHGDFWDMAAHSHNMLVVPTA